MHNLVVFGRDCDKYLISDPVSEAVVRCPSAYLQRARFAEGALVPQETMYYLESVPENPDLAAGDVSDGAVWAIHRPGGI